MFFADEALGSCGLGFDHIVVGDGLGQVGRGIEVFETIRSEVAAVERGFSIEDVFGYQQPGHGGMTETTGAEVGAEEETGERGDWADIGEKVDRVADEADAVIVDLGVLH